MAVPDTKIKRMRITTGEPSSRRAQVVDLRLAVKELNGLNSQDLYRLLKDAENFTIHYLTKNETLLKIDMDKLVKLLPVNLTAVLMRPGRDESVFRYLLCGIRLLHSLCIVAPRLPKFDQIFLDDMETLEKLMDLVFYILVALSGYRQEGNAFSHVYLLRSALVACDLCLLTGFISPQWREIVPVLLAHPRVDMFMEGAFGSVRMVVRCLEITLVACYIDFSMEPNLTAEQVTYYLCQQCEASLQFLQSLCQQKLFKERLLKNKQLCRKGSILFLAQSILKLDSQHSFPTRIMAAISRLKAKILSILLSLCEAESLSFLDEVASSSESLDVAKSIVSLVLDLLKTAFGRDPGHLTAADRSCPMGLVQLNAMRVAAILSDDSNFRSYLIDCFTGVLTAIISLSHRDFLSCWCSSNLLETEEDATLEYDIFTAVGWILDNTTSLNQQKATILELSLIPKSMPRAYYAHHRTSLFVKVIANLYCFLPDICKEQERNHFILKVLHCLQMDLSNLLPGFSFPSDAPKAATASKNLRSLIIQAESLVPNFLNPEDVQLLRVFFGELQSLIASTGFEGNRVQDAQITRGCSPSLRVNINHAELNKRSGNMKGGMFETSAFPGIVQHNATAENANQGRDLNRKERVGGKGISGKIVFGGARDMDKDLQNAETSDSDTIKIIGESPEDEKTETVQRRKRKRTIMNDEQLTLIERALLDEPDMQRNAASLQSWADELSLHGSEVTISQLKNWLNNRKARLARRVKVVQAADIDSRVPEKQRGLILGSHDSPDSIRHASTARKDLDLTRIASGDNSDPAMAKFVDAGHPKHVQCVAGQYVRLIDVQGNDIGKGKIVQVHGTWYGKKLEKSQAYVVDVCELNVDKGLQLPFPSVVTGTSFAEAETKFGFMRVLWGFHNIHVLQSE
ncbi:hypothetical protein Lal_00019275 [Lupinus albus]|uniref:Putative Homeobox domain-containing protein n=1 Tax=Lupinus albus TaxID=3870 RepID=A0A6A4R4P9_LUPAL|nr:putative Homeobox domain-containing protein [Lupinus albus]KAF1899153.1 hypothetical protein Lal_00019275 [Lupinus albus]